jgi:hypothetical protein
MEVCVLLSSRGNMAVEMSGSAVTKAKKASWKRRGIEKTKDIILKGACFLVKWAKHQCLE